MSFKTLFKTQLTIFLEESSQYILAISIASLIETFIGISSSIIIISQIDIYIGKIYDKSIFSTLNLGAYFCIIFIKKYS